MAIGTNMATASMIAMRMRTRDPAGEDNRAGASSKVSSGRTTPMSHSAKKRQMTPEEFLHRITDFVRSAEISEDGQSGVWPALVLKREGGGSGAGSLKATSAATSSRQSPVRDSLRKHSSRGGSPRA